jgi:molybdopterin-guanine dinucleotide biosynthesis protein A
MALHRFIREAAAEIIAEEEIRAAGFPDSLFRNFNTPEDWEQLNR